MNAYVPSVTPPTSRWRLGIAAAVFLGTLALLYLRAEAVAPEAHVAYTRLIRELRQIDTQLDAELLAKRLGLSRNYDALTAYATQIQASALRIGRLPDFLSAADQAEVAVAIHALQAILQRKLELIDHFKRSDAVLLNSLAYFPSVTRELLDPPAPLPAGALRDSVERYARAVLEFARQPEPHLADRLADLRRDVALKASGAAHERVGHLLRHGDAIAGHLLDIDRLTQDILSLNSDRQLETLIRRYLAGHGAALAGAAQYRSALYALALLLAAYLSWTFWRLERTRRSLARAHDEVQSRYTAQQAAETELRLHASAFRSGHDGIALSDASGNILDVNPAFTRITGWERHEVVGRNPRFLQSGRHDAAFYAAMWRTINAQGCWSGEIWNRNKFGDIYPELLSISAVHDAGGRLTNYVAVFTDIGQLKAQEQQLAQMAYYDALTQLPNRALLADRLEQGIAQTHRTRTLMAVCYLDLDGFKPVNDRWGHEAGDKVLIDIADRLKDSVRGGDTVARLGGDEFALLLLGLGSLAEAETALARLLAAINRPLTVLPEPQAVSASIGVALFPVDESDADTLLRHADQAMYHAKQAGKNRYRFFDTEQDRSLRSRQDRLARIGQAIDDGELLLYYQPKVNMRSGRVVGAEALLRWQHPEHGLLPPADFLPTIEDDDLIKEVGDWVIEAALAQMEVWHAHGLDLAVSVNVAGRQLQAPEFVEKLKVALFLHPAVAGRLELEVLETAALEDVVKTSRVIDACRALGVQFALDDFGTGYSSLTYLKRLPAETIKIDQSFVREILSDHNNLVIVQGVIGLANAFQRNIVAEGVETAEHGRLLLQLDCDQAQGYGIARPMPADEFLDWVQCWQPDASWQAIRDLRWEDADYPLLVAEVEHRNWVAELIHATVEGQPVPPKNLAAAADCRFGQWYAGRGRQRHGQHPSYLAIASPHHRVHDIARQMDALGRDGDLAAQRALIPALASARDDTLAAIRRLQLDAAVPHQPR